MEKTPSRIGKEHPNKHVWQRKGSQTLFAALLYATMLAVAVMLAPTAAYAIATPPEGGDASQLAGTSAQSPQALGEVSATATTVDICYDDVVGGKNISGTIGTDLYNIWAGVLEVTVNDAAQQAFCSDFHNSIDIGCYSNSAIGATNELVACALQYYPAETGLSDTDAAARQAVIWHITDGFELTAPDDVKSLYDTILADVEAKHADGQCDALSNHTLTIDPSHTVNFLAPDEHGGFLSSPHEYTITLMRGALPVANHPVEVTTTLGTLSFADGMSPGSPLIVTTDANGEAKIQIAHNAAGTATIAARAAVTLPTGTSIDPGATIQKLIVSGRTEFSLQATAIQQWEPGGQIVVQKFHDIDRNGVYNSPPDLLLNWEIKYRQKDGNDFAAGSPTWTSLSLGDDGTETIVIELGNNYQVCAVENADWAPTTPVCYGGVKAGSVAAFGNVKLPALLVRTYHDTNGNGVREAGETGLTGQQFKVQRLENGKWSSSYSGQTIGDGRLAFSGILSPYNYRVVETAQSGWYGSMAMQQTVDITENKLYTVTFGILQPGVLTLKNEWYRDDTQVDAPEPATVCLQRNPEAPAHAPAPTVNGNPLTFTDGQYCTTVADETTINHVWPGSYAVAETPVAGWTPMQGIQNIDIVSTGTERVTFRNDQQQPYSFLPMVQSQE